METLMMVVSAFLLTCFFIFLCSLSKGGRKILEVISHPFVVVVEILAAIVGN